MIKSHDGAPLAWETDLFGGPHAMINLQLKPRLRWRVVVRTGASGKLDPSRPSRPLSWHLVTCADSGLAAAHCEEGRQLLLTNDDPSGHCLLDGVCPRCDLNS
jgi:hypothetical protein